MHSGTPSHAVPHQDAYRVVSIPATDTLFRHTVDRHVRSVRQRGATLRAARRSLRQRYPDAELSCQRDGGIRGQTVELWFAYWDGRVKAVAPQPSWWDNRGLARIVIDTSGRLGLLRELFRSGIRRKLGSGERLAKSVTGPPERRGGGQPASSGGDR